MNSLFQTGHTKNKTAPEPTAGLEYWDIFQMFCVGLPKNFFQW